MVNMSSHSNEKWHKFVVLLADNKNLSNRNSQIYTINLVIVHGVKQKLIYSNEYKNLQ